MDEMCIIMCFHSISCQVSPVVSFWTQFYTDNDTSKPLLIMYGSQKNATLAVKTRSYYYIYSIHLCSSSSIPPLKINFNRSKGGSKGGKGGR